MRTRRLTDRGDGQSVQRSGIGVGAHEATASEVVQSTGGAPERKSGLDAS